MAVDIETLLTPVSEEAPSGPDLAYDPIRAEIEQAFERPVSIDVTGAEAGVSDVDWRKIVGLIEMQSGETKDIWLAVYLCRAGAATGDIELVLRGAEYLAGLCERSWDSAHPQLEEYGYQGRKGPCESLANLPAFLGPLRNTALLAHPRLGRFSAKDFERFRAGGAEEDGYINFRAALNDTPEETLVEIGGRIEGIRLALKQTDDILTAKADGDTGPNLQPAYDTLQQMRRAVFAFVTTPPDVAEAEDPGKAPGAAAKSSDGGSRIAGRVDSREDVLKALEAITDYYRRREPGSPTPLLLQRAREWVNLDFLEVLRDIAPGGLDEARSVLKFRVEQEDE